MILLRGGMNHGSGLHWMSYSRSSSGLCRGLFLYPGQGLFAWHCIRKCLFSKNGYFKLQGVFLTAFHRIQAASSPLSTSALHERCSLNSLKGVIQETMSGSIIGFIGPKNNRIINSNILITRLMMNDTINANNNNDNGVWV